MAGDAAVSAAAHPASTLLLVYPPPDSPMSERALAAYLAAGGTRIAYVGEWQGDTATAAFEDALTRTCQLTESVPLPNWGETRAALTVWRARPRRPGSGIDKTGSADAADAAAAAVPGPLACQQCFCEGVPVWRCRLTGVLRCSAACAAKGGCIIKVSCVRVCLCVCVCVCVGGGAVEVLPPLPWRGGVPLPDGCRPSWPGFAGAWAQADEAALRLALVPAPQVPTPQATGSSGTKQKQTSDPTPPGTSRPRLMVPWGVPAYWAAVAMPPAAGGSR
jgi:hypothetical protein